MKDEYAKVGVPMLPVVRGEDETRRQILLYTLLLFAITLLPFCAAAFGRLYLVARWLLGVGFIGAAVRALPQAPTAAPRCASTSSRSPTSRCCSPRWSPTSSSRIRAAMDRKLAARTSAPA